MVAVGFALAGGKASALVAGNLMASFATLIAMWVFAPFRVLAVFRVNDARRILAFGLHLTGSHVFNYFSRNADNVLVGRFLGSTPLGFYQMGYTLMAYPLQSFSMMMEQVVYPALAKFSDDHARLRAAYLRTCRLIALVAFPAMLGLAVTAHPFVRVFLGPKWLPVAGLLLVFAPLGALQTLYAPIYLIFSTQGRTDLLFRWQIFASISYVLSFIVGLRWGIMGVATSYAIVWTALMYPSFAIPLRLINQSPKKFFAALWPTTWHGLAMVAVAGGWLYGLRRLGHSKRRGATGDHRASRRGGIHRAGVVAQAAGLIRTNGVVAGIALARCPEDCRLAWQGRGCDTDSGERRATQFAATLRRSLSRALDEIGARTLNPDPGIRFHHHAHQAFEVHLGMPIQLSAWPGWSRPAGHEFRRCGRAWDRLPRTRPPHRQGYGRAGTRSRQCSTSATNSYTLCDSPVAIT